MNYLKEFNVDLNKVEKEVRQIKKEKEGYQDIFNGVALPNLAKYFGENIGWYWD